MKVAKTAGTGTLATGSIVKSVDDATNVTLSNAPTVALSGGATVLTFTGVGPNLFKHNQYMGESCRNHWKIGCMDGWDSSNQKWTGGPITLMDNFGNRNPIGFLSYPNGNVSAGASTSTVAGLNAYYPAGGKFVNLRETTINADDIDTVVPTTRGWASRLQAQAIGSGHYRGLLINQDNPTTGQRQGYDGDANGSGYASYLLARECVQVAWTGQDITVEADTTKTWLGNITEAATGLLDGAGTGSAGNLNRTALANAGINGLTSLSVWGTFRAAYPDMAGITVVNANATLADQIATELNVWEFMCSPAGREKFWPIRINQHFRAPAGV